MNAQILTIVRWIARISGSISLAILIFFALGHIFGSANADATGVVTTNDLVSMVFFPVSTIIGLGLAWKKEGLGGIITVAGIVCFHLVRPDQGFSLIDVLAAPGLVFIVYWAVSSIQPKEFGDVSPV